MTGSAREHGRIFGRVSTRPATWLAWLLWVVTLAFGATLLDWSEARWYWFVLSHYFWRYPEDYAHVLQSVILVFAVPAYATVGAVVASLRPKNGVGWLCLALSLMVVQGLVLENWLTTDATLVTVASLLSGLAWVLTVPPLAVTLMLLIFPEGRLPSRRWWVVVGMALAHPVVGPLTEPFRNHPVVGLVRSIGFSVSLVALLVSVLAVVLRWRRSRGQERQQIKLLVYAVVVTVAGVGTAVVSWYVSSDVVGAQSYPTVLAGVVGFAGIALGIPAAIGIAILRHRLYGVDVVINRTLVYGSLTVLLVLVYFGIVTATQATFQTFTSQEEPPQLVVVASTLVIAALFNPLRGRLQSFIDRRFYRRKYDAAKTLAAFGSRLRNETDLDALGDDLVGVTRETVQPAHISLWLRP